MKNFSLIIMTIVMSISLACCGRSLSNSADETREGEYVLVDLHGEVSGVSDRQFERDRANAVGTIFHIRKYGDNYKVTTDFDNEADALLFTRINGSTYSCHNGGMTLKFTTQGAEIQAIDGANQMCWELEKQ